MGTCVLCTGWSILTNQGICLQPGAQAGVTQGPGHQGGGFQCGGDIVLFRLWDSGPPECEAQQISSQTVLELYMPGQIV